MMECNKDEAIRAKEIAEKKMQSNDFEGARRVAMKAQQLFPELENINQLLTVCNVHCASQSKILGSEKDFYGILQLDKFADEASIKRQYRKLAFALHPDKNKLPGAEAAFKFVGEANAVLLDPGKKAMYDNKCKVSVRQQAQPPSQFSGLNRRQTTSIPTVLQETFWTICPFCKTRFQYLRKFVNHVVPCQRCAKSFAAYELSVQHVPNTSNMAKSQPKPMPSGKVGAQNNSTRQPSTQGMSASRPPPQGVPSTASGASGYQPPVFPPKGTPHAESSKTGVPNAAATRTGLQGCHSNKTARSEVDMAGSAADDVKVKSDNKDGLNVNSVAAGKHEGMAPKKEKSSGVGNTSKKRKRKHVVESSESCDTSSSNDSEDAFEEDFATYTACPDSGVDGAHCTRTSSRQRQNISYSEQAESPSKRSSKSKSSGVNVVKEAVGSNNVTEPSGTSAVNNKANVNSEGNGYSKKSFSDGTQMEKVQKSGLVDTLDDIELDLSPDDTSNQTVYQCPDAEFTDFDKGKEEHCFAVDQIWALYDTLDGMPRFYAAIKKVFKPGFKLRIKWLESDPEDDDEITWVTEELPFGCGRFQWGDSEINSDRLSFSHQINYKFGKGKKSIFVHPQKGEIWALIKDWNINWNSDPENHKKYKFEIVEVVSDYSEDAGISVSYLDKVRGFFCLFQRASVRETDFLLIRPDQMLRFSHRIPSSKMTGTEREGVPVGSFELDPASLPQDPDDICYPLKVMTGNGNLQNGIDRLGNKSENVVLPGKYADGQGKSVADLNANANFQRRSPRGIKTK